MKMTIVGIECSEGISKKGSAYSIGQVHAMAALAPALGGNTAKGSIGTTYRTDPILVKKIAHLSFPLTCEVTTEAQVRFGNREEIIIDINPVELVRKAA